MCIRVTMKKIGLFFVVIYWLTSVQSQLDTSIFMQTNKIATNDYYFNIPEICVHDKPESSDFKEKKFDFTGAALPRMH